MPTPSSRTRRPRPRAARPGSRAALAVAVAAVVGSLGVLPGPAAAQEASPPATAPVVAPTAPPTGPPATSPGPAPTAGSDGAPAEPPPTTAVPRQRTLEEQTVIDATIRLYKVKADLADLDRSAVDLADRLAAAERALAETETKLTAARTELTEIRSTLQSRAAIVYQRHSDKLGMVLSVDRVVNLSAGNHYAESVAAVDNREIDRLRTLIDELEAQRAEQDAVRRDLAGQKERLDRSRADLQAEADRLQADVDRLGGVPIMGQSVLTGAEIAAWFKSTGQRARLMNDTPIDDLAEMYVAEGNTENVRGDLAFAQAVLETGSFGHAQDNNFAGIGACDSCTSQYLFPTPRDGVRAQIQLLRNYADPFSRAAMLKNPLDATLHGTDPVTAAQRFDTFSFKGRAPVWNVMGAGNWATDPLYAGKVLTIYSRMLAFKAGLPK